MLKELSGYFNSIKKNQAKIKVTLREIKKNLQGLNSGVDEAKNQINDLEHKGGKNIQSEQQEEKRIQKTKGRLRSLWDNFKCTNIGIMEVLEGEEKEQEIENVFENILKENFPNLVKEIYIQVQEAQIVPNKRDSKRTTPKHQKLGQP